MSGPSRDVSRASTSFFSTPNTQRLVQIHLDRALAARLSPTALAWVFRRSPSLLPHPLSARGVKPPVSPFQSSPYSPTHPSGTLSPLVPLGSSHLKDGRRGP